MEHLNKWKPLINFEPSVGSYLEDKGGHISFTTVSLSSGFIQEIDQHGIGPINLDYYPLLVERLPFAKFGQFVDPRSTLHYIRTRFDDFLPSNQTGFEPYETEDQEKWESDDYLGAVMTFNLRHLMSSDSVNLEDAPVIVSKEWSQGWRFSTCWTGADNWHPVSGHREFGIKEFGDRSYIFYIKGADRQTKSPKNILGNFVQDIASLVNIKEIPDTPVPKLIPDIFEEGDNLWRKFRRNICDYINNHYGEARIPESNHDIPDLRTVSERHDWSDIRSQV